MADIPFPRTRSLFATRDSVEEVMKEGLAQLPITTPNQLITLLMIQQNTILDILNED